MPAMPVFVAYFAIWKSIDVFPGAESRENFYLRNTVKKFAWARGQNYGVATTLFLQGLARAAIERERSEALFTPTQLSPALNSN